MIALTMIMKGTEKPEEIARALSSIASHVDAIYITSTQVEDSPAIKLARSFGANMSFFKWTKDFSEARNFALDQIPDDYEWIVWMDTDDVITGASIIREAVKQPVDAIYATYNYEIDKDGRVLQSHPRERIVRKKLFRWGAQGLPVGALHENLTPSKTVRSMFAQEIVWNHYPEEVDRSVKDKRNHEILLNAYEKEGENHDPRTTYYLARSFFDLGEWTKAEDLFYAYLEKSGWDEERATAKNYLGEIYRLNEKPKEAVECYFSAIKERRDIPQYYINLGMAYTDLEKWDDAIHWTTIGLKLPAPKTAMVQTPIQDQVRALDTLYRSFMAKRKIKQAYAVSKELSEVTGTKWAKKQEKFAWDILRWTDMSKTVGSIIEELHELKEDEKIEVLLKGLPSSISENGYIQNFKKKYVKPVIWPNKSIVYYVGPGVEQFWDENSTAIGGSETAVINLTREWAKDGYKVVVYGVPEKEHVSKDGVEWREWHKFNPNDTFDILINWRNPDLIGIKARKKIVDFHDVPTYVYFTKELINAVDHFLVKSEYQKSLIDEEAAREKCVVISNGYKPYSVKEKHNNKKVIYASSYDRGLEFLLKWGWPVIKKAHPDAELHIYYGWDVFDLMSRDNPERMMWKDKMIALMKQEGVYEHGRINQKDLLQEKAHASVHYYPTTFEEIDCISVRESAAVGCIPVTSNYAVFETKDYVLKEEGNARDKRTQEAIAEKVVEVLSGNHEGLREEFKSIAQKENWQEVAKKWQSLAF